MSELKSKRTLLKLKVNNAIAELKRKGYTVNSNSINAFNKIIFKGQTSTLNKFEKGFDQAIKEKVKLTVGSVNALANYKKPEIRKFTNDIDSISYKIPKSDISKLSSINVEFTLFKLDKKKNNRTFKTIFSTTNLKFLKTDWVKFELKSGVIYESRIGTGKYSNKNITIVDIYSLSIPFNDQLIREINFYIEYGFYFEVKIIGSHEGIKKPNLQPLSKRKVRGSLKCISNDFVSNTSINGTILSNEPILIKYVKESKHKNSCLFDAIINQYKNIIESKYKFRLTYQNLFNLCFPNEKYVINMQIPASPEDVIPFFEKFKINFYIVDITNKKEKIYTPDKLNANINHNNFYLLIHNDHAYEINTNLHKLRNIEEDRVEVSKKYIISKFLTETIIMKEFDELKKYNFNECKEQYIRIAYLGSLQELFTNLLNNNYEPKINILGSVIMNIYFNINILNKKTGIIKNKIITLFNPSLNEDDKDVMIDDKNELKLYDKYNKLVYESLINNTNKSTYDENFIKICRKYRQYPLTGRFIDDDFYDSVEANDICKAYPSSLLKHKLLPVFNRFDVFKKYDNSDIEDYTLYFVKKKNDDINVYSYLKVIMKDQEACIYGFVLKEIINDVDILLYCKPSKLVNNNCEESFKLLYDSDLPMNMIKLIMNQTIGKLGKLINKKSNTYLFDNEEEAYYFDKLFNNTSNIDINDKKYYIHTKTNEEDLIDGFFPIYMLVLDQLRLTMGKLFKEVDDNGGDVIGLHVDCIFTSNYKFKIEKIDKNSFDSIGKLTNQVEEFNIEKYIEPSPNNSIDIKQYLQINKIVDLKLIDEYDDKELAKVLLENNKTLILSELPGAGKTTSLIKACKINKWRVLVICPYNNLSRSIKKDFKIDSITLNKLMGNVENIEGIKMSKYNTDDYDCFIFDEIYCHSTYNLNMIYEFMNNNKNKYIFSAGDKYQLEPIQNDLNNVSDKRKYFDTAIKSMFNNVLTLEVSKRFTNKEDIKKLLEIKNMIFRTKTKYEDICYRYFKRITNTKQINGKCISYTNKKCNELNELMHGDKEEYYKDLELVCVERYSNESIKFYVNYIYTVINVKSKTVVINDGDNDYEVSKKLLRKHFNYNYCRTAHAVQGTTIHENIYIHDIDHYHANQNRAWLWTCITRATSLSNIYYTD
jgi:hypothetical protein